MPIVIAYHLIWTIYGYWLPNDPRGSSSKVIRRDLLKELGELHHGRRKIQPSRAQLHEFDARAAKLLKFPVIELSAAMLTTAARAFAQVIQSCKYTCYACAIMPDHVHLIIRKHKHTAETMMTNLQRESHLLLREQGFFDLQHPVWGGQGWSLFLDHPDECVADDSVCGNPIKGELRAQVFEFVTPYDNWPLHEGHSANSPYVRRLGGV
jgi:hypothetical protein